MSFKVLNDIKNGLHRLSIVILNNKLFVMPISLEMEVPSLIYRVGLLPLDVQH